MDETSPPILLSRLTELQDLLQSPGGEQQEQRVNTLAMFIARRAPNPSIRELAMRVLAEAAKLRRGEHAQNYDLNVLLAQLRAAIGGK
jgi:hypothetical protein